jgi:hypothetical protein
VCCYPSTHSPFPSTTENLLLASPYISHVVIFGTGRFLCGTLLRPSPKYKFPPGDTAAKEAYLAQLWPYIETEVNKMVPRHSRLLQPLVLLEDPSKPFLLSDKGAIKRKATLDLYVSEIEQAYKTVEEGGEGGATSALKTTAFTDIATVADFIRTLVSEYVGRNVADDDDYFNSGLDSLLAVRLRLAVVSALKEVGSDAARAQISRNLVYAYPNVASLSRYIWSLIEAENGGAGGNDNKQSAMPHDTDDIARAVDEAIAKLTSSFSKRPSATQKADDGEVYVVSGTTGSLGSTFLSLLLQQPAAQVRRVYCLNRTGSKGVPALDRHRASFAERDLDALALESAVRDGRAVLVDTDVTKERIGMRADTYAQVYFAPPMHYSSSS